MTTSDAFLFMSRAEARGETAAATRGRRRSAGPSPSTGDGSKVPVDEQAGVEAARGGAREDRAGRGGRPPADALRRRQQQREELPGVAAVGPGRDASNPADARGRGALRLRGVAHATAG